MDLRAVTAFGEGNQMWADRTLKFRSSSSKLPRVRCPFMIVSRSQCLLLSGSDARVVLLPEWHLLGNARSDHFAWNLEITRVPTIRDPIARPPRGERSLASGDFHPPQFVARNFVPFKRSLIGGVRRPLGGDHTRSRTASYTFGEDESGNLGIAIVMRHDLPLPAG
jgi:hypothetical protein